MNTEIQNEETERKDNDLEAKIIENDLTIEKSPEQENLKKVEIEENNVENKKDIEQNVEEKPRKMKIENGILISAIIVLLITIFFMAFALFNIKNTKIFSGIKIDDIDIKDLSKEQAIAVMEQKILESNKIVITAYGKDYSIEKENINLQYNVEEAIEEAYNEGRNKNIFNNNYNILKNIFVGKNIKTNVEFDLESLQNEVKKIDAQLLNGVKESSFHLDGNNLVVNKGKAGKGIDLEDLNEQIKNSVGICSQKKILAKIVDKEPLKIDLEKIKIEINKNNNVAFEIDIDIKKANEILAAEKEEYIIPLIIGKTKDEYIKQNFPHLLGKCTTRYNESNVSRSTNLKVATRTLNGKILMPGEIFSFNKGLGKRTYAKGYRKGGAFSGGKVVQTIGGGICQVCSTIYDAAIYANLEIVERYNHRL